MGRDCRVSSPRLFEALTAGYGVPYHLLPGVDAPAEARDAALLELARSLEIELVVLARYMQVLGPAACRELAGRAINIHHSFLPSFKGARPYAQAHARGVKLIGATAHYVTDQLAGSGAKVTRLAHGVPVGGELDYLDDGTLAAAMRSRTPF